LVFVFNKGTFGIFIKFGESFSLGSLLNQSQTYQGNPYGVYPDLSSFTESGVIQISVACIKRSAPSQDHIIWYQSFGSWYRFYIILLFFFLICPGSCFVLVLLFVFLFVSLFHSCSCSCHVFVLVLVSCVFQTLCQKKICLNSVSIIKKKVAKILKKKTKKRRKERKKESGSLIFEPEIEAVRGFFLVENCWIEWPQNN